MNDARILRRTTTVGERIQRPWRNAIAFGPGAAQSGKSTAFANWGPFFTFAAGITACWPQRFESRMLGAINTRRSAMRSLAKFGMLALTSIASIVWAGDPEFGGQCATAMSRGNAVPTSCSVTWVAPDEKIYCFMNQAARDEFLKMPTANAQKAKEFWDDPAFWERFNRQKDK